MPETKTQKVAFGLIMSYMMAIGMEVYNTAIKMGVHLNPGGFSTMTYAVFAEALKETAFMGLIVYAVSTLIGNHMGEKFALRRTDMRKDNPYFCMLMRQAGTIAFMCPVMSLIATLLFSVILGHQPLLNVPVIWFGTLMKNFPMAFFWNMFFAAPATRAVFGKAMSLQMRASHAHAA